MDSVIATPGAVDAIMRLRARHGTIAFHQSGANDDGSGVLRLAEARLPRAPDDIQLGEIGGVPLLIDRDRYRSWGRPDLVVDIVPGASDGLSLKAADGVHLTTGARAITNPEAILP